MGCAKFCRRSTSPAVSQGMLARKCGCERCLQVEMLWVTQGHGPGGPQGSCLRAIMVSLLHLFLENSVLLLSLSPSLPLCCLQAVCMAQHSLAMGAGGAVLPRGGNMLPAQTTRRDPPPRKSPFPNGLCRVGCYSFSLWILGQNLHNLPITHRQGVTLGVERG